MKGTQSASLETPVLDATSVPQSVLLPDREVGYRNGSSGSPSRVENALQGTWVHRRRGVNSRASFEDLAIYYRDSGYSRAMVNADNEPEQIQGGWVAANLFPLLGIGPQIGRVFTADEEVNRERVVVLSHAWWVRRFAAASDVIGKTVTINGSSFQIIGVMSQAFQFPARDQMFWAPRLLCSRPARGSCESNRSFAI